jgi:D-amino-acid dehydrogenase
MAGVVVLGAGVMGVTTAYYLAKAGRAVTVLDRQPEAAAETSFANAGLIAPGHSNAWASPRAPMILLKSLWRDDTALRFHLRLDPAMWRWGLQFLANCTTARNRHNTLIKLGLARYSREKLIELRQAERIAYDEIVKGCIYLYRDPVHFETGQRAIGLLKAQGYPLETIDAAGCVGLDPALAPARDKIAGAIFAPQDESGDCHAFVQRLARICEGLGVQFRYGTSVRGLETKGGRVEAVVTDRERIAADQVVLALGSYAPQIARSAGIKLPIYPVKGYSLTLPIKDKAAAPTLGGVDEGQLVAFARMGDRLRLTATADFAGYDTSHKPENFTTMLKVARELFPEAAHYDQPRYWACLRPMTPDGPPILGATQLDNLFLNTGSGHMGWTMACGSSRLVTDLMLGRKPDIPLRGMTLDRY